MKEKIQKILSFLGVSSRRKIEEMILNGRIKINSLKLTKLGKLIDINKDLIHIDNLDIQNKIEKENRKKMVYILFHKPFGVISTTKDENSRKSIIDFMPLNLKKRIYPIGRLDYSTEGIILLTNDGDLTNKLLKTSNKIKKIYIVKIKGYPKYNVLKKLIRGIYLDKGISGKIEVELIGQAKVNTWLKVVLTQGKNKQIRKMFWRINCPVLRLIRTQFASISIEGVPVGKYRLLKKQEIQKLKSL